LVLHRDPFDDIAGDTALAAVVELSRSRVSEFVPWLSPRMTCSGRRNTIPCFTDLGNTKISPNEVSIVMVGIGWPSVALEDTLLWIVT